MQTLSRRLLAGALLSPFLTFTFGTVNAMPMGNAVKVPLTVTADCKEAEDFRSTGYGVCRLRAVVPLEAPDFRQKSHFRRLKGSEVQDFRAFLL